MPVRENRYTVMRPDDGHKPVKYVCANSTCKAIRVSAFDAE